MLGKVNCQLISRNPLINISIYELSLSFKQATGLVGPSIHELKKQGLVLSSGRPKHISYVFSLNIKNNKEFQLIFDEKHVLSSEKETSEKELSMISYELEVYQELLKKFRIRS